MRARVDDGIDEPFRVDLTEARARPRGRLRRARARAARSARYFR
jgi:hypothetical protein